MSFFRSKGLFSCFNKNIFQAICLHVGITVICITTVLCLLLINKNSAMTTRSHVSRRLTATLAIIFFLPALVIFILWSTLGLRFGQMPIRDKIDSFLNYFPSWLQNFTTLHVISLVLCVTAIILAARSFKKHLLSVRVLMLMVVICSLFLIIFDIFQLT